MNAGDNIYFFLIAIGVLTVISIVGFMLRKRKKAAIMVSLVLVACYIGYYAYFPTLQEQRHAERYQQLEAYLETTYPDKQLSISPKHYAAGERVGEFQVYDTKTPKMGVVLRVDQGGQVAQVATWTNGDVPMQQDVWQELVFSYGDVYSLDKEMPDITKEDMWFDGELSVFALMINGIPSIAIYHYSNEGYGLVELKEGNSGEFVTAEVDGRLFIYIDQHYPKEMITIHLASGASRTLQIPEQKGQLIVEDI